MTLVLNGLIVDMANCHFKISLATCVAEFVGAELFMIRDLLNLGLNLIAGAIFLVD